MSESKHVLLIGVRGYVGSQILDAVVATGKFNVHVLLPAGSKMKPLFQKIEAKGANVVHGDTGDKDSLIKALHEIHTVICCTMTLYRSGNPDIDKTGERNVVDACKKKGVKRLIYCSVLTADKAKQVDHFRSEHEVEKYMKKAKIPFVVLRSGAFLDPEKDLLGGDIKHGKPSVVSSWNQKVPVGMIYTPDLAKLFADAIDLPESANGKFIDVGWSRPISMQEVVKIISMKLNRKIGCYTFPKFFRTMAILTAGPCKPFLREKYTMFNYFDTGVFVNDPSQQQEYFGVPPPTPEDAIGRYVDKLMAATEGA